VADAQAVEEKKSATVLVVSFSGALERASAEAVGDYHLTALGKSKKPGKPVPVTAAVYDPAQRTVTLTPRGKFAKQTLQLTIAAAGTLDAQSRPIDGDRDGKPGGDFQATFGKAGIRLSRAAGPASISSSSAGPLNRLSPATVDVLFAQGILAHRPRRGRSQS
jgi:hypothetical protein